MLKAYVKYLLMLVCLPYIFDVQAMLEQHQQKPSFFHTYRLPAVIGASGALAGTGIALEETEQLAPYMMWGAGTLATALLAKKLWDESRKVSWNNFEKSYIPLCAGAVAGYGLGFVLAKIVQNRGWNPYILAAIAGVGVGSFGNFKVRQMLDVDDHNLVQSKSENPINVDQNQESKKVFVAGLPEDEPENAFRQWEKQAPVQASAKRESDSPLLREVFYYSCFQSTQQSPENFIEDMNASPNSTVEYWRNEALKRLDNALTTYQKKLIARAFDNKQIVDIINNTLSLYDKMRIDRDDAIRQDRFYDWIYWFNTYKKTVSDRQAWLSEAKKEAQQFFTDKKYNDIHGLIENVSNDHFVEILEKIEKPIRKSTFDISKQALIDELKLESSIAHKQESESGH